jgi:DNA-directed RNA polymerase specialized sigma subunit
MTEVQIRGYLNRAYRAKEMIGSMQEELLYLQELAEMTEGMDADGRKGSLMAQIIEKERRQKGRIEEYLEAAEQVQEAIEAVENPDYKTILRMRYLNFKPWDVIAQALHFSSVWIYHLHKKALVAVGKAIMERGNQSISI